jgi:hypothetical protein
MKFNYESLITFCNNNNIKLLKEYYNDNINRGTKIRGKCITDNCLNEFDKNFNNLYKTNGYCRSCTNKFALEKRKATSLEKYGVENPMQNAEFIEKIKATNLEKYGVECSLQNAEVREKIKATNLEKYGVEHPMQNAEVREKIKATNLENYGVEHAFQSEEIKEKMKTTNLKKYGVENPSQSEEVKEKKKATIFKNYGVENPMQSEEIREKSKSTSLIKYGVEHPMQNAEVMEKASKNAYKLKEYTYPSGAIIKMQGYEHFALDELLQELTEHDIVTGVKNVPIVWYEDDECKRHRYYVDIFIPSQNRCIEVKSPWTLEKKRHIVFLKQQALKDAGYKCEIWVYNAKGEKVECYI